MNCPVCKRATLFHKTVSSPLAMRCCNGCGGKWLSASDYWSWLDARDGRPPKNQYTDFSCEVHDAPQVKICPDCGRILIKFKVGHGLDFKLDHCNHCNGVWFDKNEWEMLASRNLHDEVHKIFTTAWQKEIGLEEKARYFARAYEQKFGADYARLKEFKAWLDAHALKASILAFLADAKPYE